MTDKQKEDLFKKWGLYEALTRKAMVNEYQEFRKIQNFDDTLLRSK